MYLDRRFARGETDPALRASRWSNRLAQKVRELGPYAAIALLLPGGSLIALALWSRRNRAPATIPLLRTLVVMAMFGTSLVLPGST